MDNSTRIRKIAVAVAAVSLFEWNVSCGGKADTQQQVVAPPHLLPVLTDSLPHDTTSFTQGLFFSKNRLYESTGLYGKSTIRQLDTNGTVLLSRPVDEQFFAEGCTFFGSSVYQITWQQQRCFVYSPEELLPVDTLQYTGEGWGLSANDSQFIMSNGSDTLYFRNSRFEIVRKLPVTNDGAPLERLNELEYARGYIYANVWFSDFIFEIDPETGAVERIIDCSELVAREAPASDEQVLNGIAYHEAANRFFLTGKNWKHIFIVTLPER
jgi:glutaminyl-peptide cyclotransferase